MLIFIKKIFNFTILFETKRNFFLSFFCNYICHYSWTSRSSSLFESQLTFPIFKFRVFTTAWIYFYARASKKSNHSEIHEDASPQAKYSQSRSCLSKGLLSTLSLTVQTVTLYSLPGIRPVNVTLVSMSSTIRSFVVLFSSLIRNRYKSNLDDWTGVRVYLNVNESGWSWSTTTTTSDWISGTEFDRLVFFFLSFFSFFCFLLQGTFFLPRL